MLNLPVSFLSAIFDRASLAFNLNLLIFKNNTKITHQLSSLHNKQNKKAVAENQVIQCFLL
jgi:hypothetical protein